MAAEDLGARVLILERSPQHMRGGNTRHTRNIRCMHDKDAFNSAPTASMSCGATCATWARGPTTRNSRDSLFATQNRCRRGCTGTVRGGSSRWPAPCTWPDQSFLPRWRQGSAEFLLPFMWRRAPASRPAMTRRSRTSSSRATGARHWSSASAASGSGSPRRRWSAPAAASRPTSNGSAGTGPMPWKLHHPRDPV